MAIAAAVVAGSTTAKRRSHMATIGSSNDNEFQGGINTSVSPARSLRLVSMAREGS
jgi:hypothetical protein